MPNRPNSRVWTTVEQLAFQQKLRLRIEKHFRERYVDQAVSGVDLNKYTRKFSKHSKDVRDALLGYSLDSLAAVDGGEKVTDVLQELGFRDAEFSSRELSKLAVLALRVQVLQLVLSQTQLNRKLQDKILNRFIEQLIPNRDNPKIEPVQNSMRKLRTQLESLVQDGQAEN